MWAVKEEWIDLAQGHHYVMLHNPDVLVTSPNEKNKSPVEHHLIIYLKQQSCPICGAVQAGSADFVNTDLQKKKTIDALNAHHQSMMQYREMHPHVPLRSGPKK